MNYVWVIIQSDATVTQSWIGGSKWESVVCFFFFNEFNFFDPFLSPPGATILERIKLVPTGFAYLLLHGDTKLPCSRQVHFSMLKYYVFSATSCLCN